MKPNKWLGLCVGMLLAVQVHADGFKLGYINIERVYREAAPVLVIQGRLAKEFAPRRAELVTLQSKIKQIEVQLVRSDLSDNERKNDQRELDALMRDFGAKSAALTEDFRQRRGEEFAAFLDRANRVVRKMAQDGHFDLILQDSVYVDPKYDLTEALLKELDK